MTNAASRVSINKSIAGVTNRDFEKLALTLRPCQVSVRLRSVARVVKCVSA